MGMKGNAPKPAERVRELLGARLVAPTVPWPIEDLIAHYKAGVTGLREQATPDSSDIMLTFIARAEIEQRWADLVLKERRRVERLDAILAGQHANVAQVLPNALSTDRRRWWSLDEGPQVREQAKGVA